MRIHVAPNLWYGDMELCARTTEDEAIVHACKDGCHRKAVGYTGRAPKRDDPHYYSKRMGLDLFLNLIDPPVPLFATPVFLTALAFLEEHGSARIRFVHCTEGVSRSPSLVLLHLARNGVLGKVPTYAAAREVFTAKWPYAPGKGIQLWLEQNWNMLMECSLA
jgi:hypothetical protein